MFIIKDNFYNNPEEVRNYALSLDFDVAGNYPGLRTRSCVEPFLTNMKLELENILGRKITYWPTGYNSAFQYTTKDSKTWVHHDDTQWAAVVYLTPDAQIEAGTGIYRHKETQIYKHTEESLDLNTIETKEEEWELLDSCANLYNRIVVYEGMLYHRSILPGFGNTKYDGRLFQTFFFNTEY